MGKWYVGIDETGDFSVLDRTRKSYAVAVVTRKNNDQLSSLYRQAYRDSAFDEAENYREISQILRHFHYAPNRHSRGYSREQKEYLLNHFSPHMSAVLRSMGRPALLANPQDWWLRAASAVIRGFFSLNLARSGDEVHFEIDRRAEIVLGLPKGHRDRSNQEGYAIAGAYHKFLKQQLEEQLREQIRDGNIRISLVFCSDRESPLVNLADLACGLVRDNKLDRKHIHGVPCASLLAPGDVAGLLQIDAHAALNTVLNQAVDGDFSQTAQLPAIFTRLSGDTLAYTNAWREIHYLYSDYLQLQGQFPAALSRLDRLRKELEKEQTQPRYAETISGEQQITFLNQLIGLDTHLGATEDRYGERYLSLLRQQNTARLSDHWEKHLRLFILRAQFYFNAYRFEAVLNDLMPLWDAQDKLYTLLSQALPAPGDGSKPPDRSLAQILGTLGQACMFLGRWDEAIHYLEEDFDLADAHSRSKPASYLLCIYLKQKNLEKCHHWFERQVGVKAPEFLERDASTERNSAWARLSYLRLRGLELELKGRSELPALPPAELQKHEKDDYPWPLILKWAAFGLLKEERKDEAKKLLLAASKQLAGSRQFTLRSLALSPYQMLGPLRTEPMLRSEYKTLLQELTAAEPGFAEYVERLDLQQIWDNDGKTLWQRALCLPGYYA